MNSEIKIIKFLISNRIHTFTIKKISENCKINYRIAYEKVIKLEKEGLIETMKIGNARACKATFKFNNKVFLAENDRQNDLFKKKDFLIIKNRLSSLKFPFIALLFGSHAKGKATKNSDIDILTIGNNEKEITTELSLLPDKIHLTHVSYENFIAMAKSNEFSVVNEAIKNNIILIGIEEYYRLIKNAKS